MHRNPAFGIASLLFIILLGAAPPAAAQAGRVRCESSGDARIQCPIPPGVRVELAHEFSQAACRQNGTWGVGDGFIWVSGGCQAEFAVIPTDFVRPEARGSEAEATAIQLRACQTEADRRLPDYSYKEIRVESESRDANVANVRWQAGSQAGRCTVATNGRVLAFMTTGGSEEVGGPGNTTRITCESRGGGRQECRIPNGARITLARQLSESPCRVNDTYGQGLGHIWVTKGCRAEFDVTPAATGGGPGTTRITCQSTANARQQCPIPAGANVRLVGQLSDRPCRPNETYGVTERYIWVMKGCRGVFEVRAGAAVPR